MNKWKPGQLVTLKQENKITHTVILTVCGVVKCEYACIECPLKKMYVAIAKKVSCCTAILHTVLLLTLNCSLVQNYNKKEYSIHT